MSALVRFPRQIQIMITERCNLRCKHCAVPFEDSPADHELDQESWMQFIDVLAENGLQCLVISGGEAFLREDIIPLACYALEHGIRQTVIVTNVSLITALTAQQLADAQQRWSGFGLQISIDGASSTTHDWMRGRGAFKVLLHNILRLQELGGVVTGVNTVLHSGNHAEFQDIAQLVHNIGARNWRLFPIHAVGRGVRIQDVALSTSEWREIFKALPNLRHEYALDIMSMGPMLGEEMVDEQGFMPNPNEDLTPRYCVGPDGDFFVCPPLRSASLGNATTIHEGQNWIRALTLAEHLTRKNCGQCQFLLACVGVNPQIPLRLAEGHYGPPAA